LRNKIKFSVKVKWHSYTIQKVLHPHCPRYDNITDNSVQAVWNKRPPELLVHVSNSVSVYRNISKMWTRCGVMHKTVLYMLVVCSNLAQVLGCTSSLLFV